MLSDMELLAAWRSGDASAGKILFQRYFPAVTRFFINKVPQDHEDLVQETFMACARGRDGLRDDGRFRSYLFGTAPRWPGTDGRGGGLAPCRSFAISWGSVMAAMMRTCAPR